MFGYILKKKSKEKYEKGYLAALCKAINTMEDYVPQDVMDQIYQDAYVDGYFDGVVWRFSP